MQNTKRFYESEDKSQQQTKDKPNSVISPVVKQTKFKVEVIFSV